jgi:hypothetical protein
MGTPLLLSWAREYGADEDGFHMIRRRNLEIDRDEKSRRRYGLVHSQGWLRLLVVLLSNRKRWCTSEPRIRWLRDDFGIRDDLKTTVEPPYENPFPLNSHSRPILQILLIGCRTLLWQVPQTMHWGVQ